MTNVHRQHVFFEDFKVLSMFSLEIDIPVSLGMVVKTQKVITHAAVLVLTNNAC